MIKVIWRPFSGYLELVQLIPCWGTIFQSRHQWSRPRNDKKMWSKYVCAWGVDSDIWPKQSLSKTVFTLDDSKRLAWALYEGMVNLVERGVSREIRASIHTTSKGSLIGFDNETNWVANMCRWDICSIVTLVEIREDFCPTTFKYVSHLLAKFLTPNVFPIYGSRLI